MWRNDKKCNYMSFLWKIGHVKGFDKLKNARPSHQHGDKNSHDINRNVILSGIVQSVHDKFWNSIRIWVIYLWLFEDILKFSSPRIISYVSWCLEKRSSYTNCHLIGSLVVLKVTEISYNSTGSRINNHIGWCQGDAFTHAAYSFIVHKFVVRKM